MFFRRKRLRELQESISYDIVEKETAIEKDSKRLKEEKKKKNQFKKEAKLKKTTNISLLPYLRMLEENITEIERHTYSKTYEFTDINYTTSKQEEQELMRFS